MAAGGGGREGCKKITKRRTNRKSEYTLNQTHRLGCRQDITGLIPLLSSATKAAHSFLSHHDLFLHPSQSLSLESYLSSTSFCLSKLLSLDPSPSLSLSSSSSSYSPSPPISCWFHRFLSSVSSEDDARWTDSFRMSQPSFSLLLRLLAPSLSSLSPLPPNYVLAAALFHLAYGAPYKAVARRFGLDSATACRAFYTVCKAINDKLGHLFEFRTDINRITVGFGWISLPNCCGVLGFERFEVGGHSLGQSGSLMVQALVDSEGRFLDVSAGWPNTMKSETILRQSNLFLGIEETREMLNGPSFQLNDGSSIPRYILGDSSLPLLPWLITPFSKTDNNINSFSSSQRDFNSVHGRAMELVGKTFGSVRARWRLLSKRWKKASVESFPFITVTCCLLHNFLIKCSEAMPDEIALCSTNHDLPVFERAEDESGKRIRDLLASHMTRVFLG